MELAHAQRYPGLERDCNTLQDGDGMIGGGGTMVVSSQVCFMRVKGCESFRHIAVC